MKSLSSHTDYGSTPLDEGAVDPDPLRQFALWLETAEREGLYEPNAMVVGTVDPDGAPSSRTVLLKGLDTHGFEFVTNYRSRKGVALLADPRVTLLFPWYPLQRQVIVYGSAHPTPPQVSDAYFSARPLGSQVASAASEQSQPIASRDALEQRVRELEEQHPDAAALVRPENWGAFRVTPERIEFWQGRTSRLHDRLLYTADDTGWMLQRLQP